ncbi:hypothetical protein L9F63_004172 [Diploptera punctata]|uniref:Serpin domain-containing protein n=1 Tax=Diploptera punctata TaxID=6984 RepID=A0AAD7ZH07_DIPPU|nr:hypothetical protein L9F63_004172 [Diploptera punctata]
MTVSAPQSAIDEIFPNHTDGDKFIPPSESTFDSFDLRLCQILHKRGAGNLIVSPISLKLMLAMVYEGADNQAAEELRTALDLSEDRLASRNKYFNILKSLETKEPNLAMEVASKMFLRNDLTPWSLYKKILKYIYSADLEQLDFSKSTQAVRTINSWVSKATHGHIESMLDDVSPNTMALLLNAIYFKGLWRYPFNADATMTSTFQVSPTRKVSAEFMRLAQELYFSESVELDSKIIRLPYKMGIRDMFNPSTTNLDGIVRGRYVYVSKSPAESSIRGVVLGNRMGGESVNFYARHPFMFFIQDEKNGTVIFVGKLVDPTNSDTPLTREGEQRKKEKETSPDHGHYSTKSSNITISGRECLNSTIYFNVMICVIIIIYDFSGIPTHKMIQAKWKTTHQEKTKFNKTTRKCNKTVLNIQNQRANKTNHTMYYLNNLKCDSKDNFVQKTFIQVLYVPIGDGFNSSDVF